MPKTDCPVLLVDFIGETNASCAWVPLTPAFVERLQQVIEGMQTLDLLSAEWTDEEHVEFLDECPEILNGDEVLLDSEMLMSQSPAMLIIPPEHAAMIDDGWFNKHAIRLLGTQTAKIDRFIGFQQADQHSICWKFDYNEDVDRTDAVSVEDLISGVEASRT